MTVIVCISERGGMMFNGRRQSRDKAVIENIVGAIGDGVLFVSEFSAPLFAESNLSVISVSEPASVADVGDFVFLEDTGVGENINKVEKFVVYRWNREYPADFSLDLHPKDIGMKLVDSVEFSGKSHEKITREIWEW